MRLEESKSLSEAMQHMDPPDRQLLLLKYTEGWGYQELAQHLGVSVKTVEYRLLKARKALRVALLAH
jgi:RNA polymerase sigma-70 factor (ECF subfamily)